MQQGNYYKRIVFDLDDTISFTTTRDFENATPNQPLIDQINKLFNSGWEIIIVTARGSLSCNSLEEREAKYRIQIENWLDEHGVNYNLLDFNKILAAYYVDDKAIKPDDFLCLDIDVFPGMSGAHVFRDGEFIYKKASNTPNAILWYDAVRHLLPIPKIHAVVGEIIKMEYIRGDNSVNLLSLINSIEVLRAMPILKPIPDYCTYTDRLIQHLYAKENSDIFSDEEIYNFVELISDVDETFFDENKSMCHGDMSIDNVIWSCGVGFLIDPIYLPDVWSSWLLDVSKLLHSARRFELWEFYNHVFNHYKTEVGSGNLLFLEFTHWLRILKYASKEQKPEFVKIVRQLYNELQK